MSTAEVHGDVHLYPPLGSQHQWEGKVEAQPAVHQVDLLLIRLAGLAVAFEITVWKMKVI